MGVLTCNRKNCTNIMCDRYSCQHGYICDECFDELVGDGVETNIEDFMQSVKHPSNSESSFARFDIEFPLQDRGM